MIGVSCDVSAVDVSERCLCLKTNQNTPFITLSLKAPPIKIKLQTYLNLADRSFELISWTSCSLIRRRHFCSLLKVPAGWYSTSLREEHRQAAHSQFLEALCAAAEVHK